MAAVELFSPAEISAVTGASVKSVYKAIDGRLPGKLFVQRDRQKYLTRSAAVCFAIDREMPRHVPLSIRRHLYAAIMNCPSASRVHYESGMVSYSVDVKPIADRVDRALASYRDAMRLIVEDPAIQGGAATFRGTRIPFHQIAALLAAGVDEQALREDYPRLSPQMILAAPIYARAHPRRGRPRKPTWRSATTRGESVRRGT